jgi:hypothetical protein
LRGLRLVDLDFELEGAVELTPDQKDGIATARALIGPAVARLMANHPICPKLPPELASLSPRYEEGGTTEIVHGGAGIYLRGSVDVSTETILGILKVLQQREVLPPAP